jgi:hypothetical protein
MPLGIDPAIFVYTHPDCSFTLPNIPSKRKAYQAIFLQILSDNIDKIVI